MADIFLREDLGKLLKDKHVVFIGDSNTRALYKDFMCLSLNSTLISDKTLKQKMEPSVFGDKLVYHRERNSGRAYKEEREYSSKNNKFSFYFITKVFDDYVRGILQSITRSKGKPDVVVINSCMWDVTRWGPNGVVEYRQNLVSLMKELKRILPSNCLVIWLTTLPIAVEIRGGFLVKQLEFLKYSLRFHIMEANYYARKIVVNHGFDVLDLHYIFKFQVHRRCKDGIHWEPDAIRYMSNMLLQHISLAWDVPLPHRIKSSITSKEIYDENKNILSNNTSTADFKKVFKVPILPQPMRTTHEVSSFVPIKKLPSLVTATDAEILKLIPLPNGVLPLQQDQRSRLNSGGTNQRMHKPSYQSNLDVAKNESHILPSWATERSHRSTLDFKEDKHRRYRDYEKKQHKSYRESRTDLRKTIRFISPKEKKSYERRRRIGTSIEQNFDYKVVKFCSPLQRQIKVKVDFQQELPISKSRRDNEDIIQVEENKENYRPRYTSPDSTPKRRKSKLDFQVKKHNANETRRKIQLWRRT